MSIASDRRTPGKHIAEIVLVLLLHLGLWFALQASMPNQPVGERPTVAFYLRLVPEPLALADAPRPQRPQTPAATAAKAITPTRPAAPAPLVAGAPAPAATGITTTAPLDLEALRGMVLANERQRPGKGLGNAQETPAASLTMEQKLGTQIARSAREDCKSAYSGLGLLALIPLAVDALRDSGCKW